MINGSTVLAGVIGWPIKYSQSPRLHNKWLSITGINGVYIPLNIHPSNLKESLKVLPKIGFSGVNVTLPHKERVLNYLDIIDPLAKRIGAVNTIRFGKNSEIIGTNTDGFGFLQNLFQYAPTWNTPKSEVALLGAGGASRAILTSLVDEKVSQIRLINRTISRAERLANDVGGPIEVFSWKNIRKTIEGCDLLINATSLGMKGQPDFAFPMDSLAKRAVVTDIVYTPLVTPFLKEAQKFGFKTIDGLGMLLHQGRPGFNLWFGKTAPLVDKELRTYMLEALEG